MRNKKIRNATECSADGIDFKSILERTVYLYLKSVGITPKYEAIRFPIWNREKFSVPYYDRYGKTFMRITRKPTIVHYTPDFVFTTDDTTVYLEVKGFKNDVVPYKIRLFRELLEELSKSSDTRLCYAVVYCLEDLKILLNDLRNSSKVSTFVKN